MHITVKLFATFRFGRFAAATRHYPPSTRISTVIDELQIPGDSLALFPLVAGG
jgi:molybdopterin synthase sulfur carrier subunit